MVRNVPSNNTAGRKTSPLLDTPTSPNADAPATGKASDTDDLPF